MRVIAGEARGRRLEALPGTDVTRPTLSQVKEAMFSIVQFDLPGARVLDLYAGSGQLGIEALSRGAARCVFLDENREAVNIIMRNCKACGVFDRSRRRVLARVMSYEYLWHNIREVGGAYGTAAASISARLRGIFPPAASSSTSYCWTRPSAMVHWKRSCLRWINAPRPAASCCARARPASCCRPRQAA